ncbi:FkbM family methyltransferase [Acidianus manzaensis]|uniref:Methyltransferase FkbM domain-containing protein n=1 Tax=Acidianus manzaensis TaxID=282676 RepID=A0A1W6JWL5_9CREN|nr:FkbM family methyltransferase [Acidianus manzaensis]ARM74632.1 hypothetical protein B6F84_00395 [Acidianus manzaensis]
MLDTTHYNILLKRFFYYYRIAFKNWYSILNELRRGKRKDIEVIFRNGNETYCSYDCIRSIVDLLQKYNYDLSKILNFISKKQLLSELNDENKSYSDYLFLLSGWIKEDNVWIYAKYNLKVLHLSGVFLETFASEEYNTDVSSKEVVDVGANVGDTALYFALKGAKKVYAFEPLPSIYEKALGNIKLNNLENKILLFNAGVSSKDEVIKVPSNVSIGKSSVYSVNNQGDVEVPVFSLEKIVKEIVKEPYLLKMDCEGCEADIIMNSKPEILSSFDKIIFEHHYSRTKVKANSLMKKLEELDYTCKLKKSFPSRPAKYLGIIYCEKKK